VQFVASRDVRRTTRMTHRWKKPQVSLTTRLVDELEEGARKRGRTHDLEAGVESSEKARPRSFDIQKTRHERTIERP